jgi:MFS family permease
MHSNTSLGRAFARLAWSNLAAQAAEQIGLASALLAVLAFGAGPGAVGMLQTAQTLPFLLIAIPAGVLADRMARARLMAAAETLRVLSFVGVLVLMASDTLKTLAAANGRIELARTSALAAGPALGGALVGWIGGGPTFAVAAAMSAVAVALLAGIREPPREATPRRHVLREVREGAAFVFAHPLLRPIFMTQFTFNVALFIIQAIYVPYAVGHIGLAATGVGVTLAAFGGGMVVGALLAARIMSVVALGLVVAVGPLAGLAAALVMMLTIAVPSPLLAEFLSDGRGADLVGGEHDHVTPDRHAEAAARSRLRHQ